MHAIEGAEMDPIVFNISLTRPGQRNVLYAAIPSVKRTDPYPVDIGSTLLVLLDRERISVHSAGHS
jgi:hypothetical protein